METSGGGVGHHGGHHVTIVVRILSHTTKMIDLVRAGAISGALAVALGAFGAHGLRARVAPELLATWATASNYHLAHALATVAAGCCGADTAGALLLGGSALFSGSLYALVLTGNKKLGAVTPIGGLVLIAGWGALAWAGGRPPVAPEAGGKRV